MKDFFIGNVVERKDGNVDVHVRYAGGGEIMTFPKTYPPTTILAQIRIEFRRRELEGTGTADRYASLRGKHDV